MSKDVKKKKSEETVQDEVKNQETDAKKEEACNCESECKADESHRMRALRALRRRILRMQL